MRISMRDGSSLVRPMSKVRISYEAWNSMILSKIDERRPESIRCPWAPVVSLAAMATFYSAGPKQRRDASAMVEAGRRARPQLRHEPVADAADGSQECRRGRTILDVAPQANDEVVDRAGVDALLQSPDVLQDGAAGHRLPGVLHEIPQEIALHDCQRVPLV